MALLQSFRSASRPSPVSTFNLIVNSVLCVTLAAFVFFYWRRIIDLYPVTIESLWQIGLAEVNRRKSIKRLKQLEARSQPSDPEKAYGEDGPIVHYMASVVGYREEPGLFRRCTEAYRGVAGLKLLLVGIDGNDVQDMEMARIVESVFPESVELVPIDEPFGLMALRLAETHAFGKGYKPSETLGERLEEFQALPMALQQEAEAFAMQMVFQKAHDILQQYDVLEESSSDFQALCFYQPHVCKKDIMFTNMVFSLILGQAKGLEYLWTSDSDTIVLPNTLPQTIGAMFLDPHIGGSCTTLGIHNANESMIAALGAAAYWSELAITRGQTGAVDSVDCQPGPCAAFKLEALAPILFEWYTQTSLGIKTVVNEDRHLTTKILLANWKVTFLTAALAHTDTPTTTIRWLLQQLRWARATHIETFQYPLVYAIHGPILFVTAMRRFYGPLSIAIFTLRYVWDGSTVHAYSLVDLLGRVVLVTAYNAACNSTQLRGLRAWTYLALSQLFYQLPLPGIIFWSTVTVLQGSWGTRMRTKEEKKMERNDGWDNLGAVVSVTAWMGVVAAALARYVCSRVAPDVEGLWMRVAALGMMVALGWVLLRRAKTV